MRTQMLRLFIGLVITAGAMFGADNLIGTWKRNIATSSSVQSNPITSMTEVIEAIDGGVKTTVTGQRKDGTDYHHLDS